MRKIVIISYVIFVAILITGTAEAGDQIDTSNILIMAYYNSGTDIDLSLAIQEFDVVTESTGQYVQGIVRIMYDDPDGRNPGNIQTFELRNGYTTTYPFSTDITIRVKSDGWIVAWLTNEQNLGDDLVFWNDVNTISLPSETTLSKAIWRIADRSGLYYNKNDVNYYCYKFPDANKLLIGGRLHDGGHYIYDGESYSFLMPSSTTVYDAYLSYAVWLEDSYSKGLVKLNGSLIYEKETPHPYYGIYEYAIYQKNITTLPKDIRHNIHISAWYGSPKNILKSAVAIIYKTG